MVAADEAVFLGPYLVVETGSHSVAQAGPEFSVARVDFELLAVACPPSPLLPLQFATFCFERDLSLVCVYPGPALE